DVNEPIAGASVFVKGTTQGVTTDASGSFQLAAQGDSLSVTFIGYKPQTVAIVGQTNFTILLETDDQFLEDVVVVGYGTQNRATVTGSISEVKGDDLIKSPQPNLSNSLAGRLS